MTDNKEIPMVNRMKKNRNSILGIFLFLIAINIIAYFFYARLDLTKDKRYTITNATKNMLQHIPKKVEITVFLKGADLPAAFKQLSKSTEDLLQNFRSLSKNEISYHFVDPLGSDTTALNTLSHFRMSGIPITIDAGKKGTAQKMVFPWALVTTQNENGNLDAFPVFLQESNTPELSREILGKSEMLLEYNIANAIHQVTKKEKAAIAYLTGNQEEFDFGVSSAFNTLLKYYTVDTLNLQQQLAIPTTYNAIIINRPLTAFSEVDKFKIDQYLMHGKSVFMSIDAASGSLDSFSNAGQFNSLAIDLNTNDLFFNYGFRINSNLIEDAVSCVGIPLTAQNNNGQSVIYPWVYFPVLQNGSDHPIVKNLNGVLGRFVSSIDVNENNPQVKETDLLTSSAYSAIIGTPTPIILETAMVDKNPADFRKKHLLASILLEGSFPSLYVQRTPIEVANFKKEHAISTIDKSNTDAKMIVVSDGEILMNEFSEKDGPSDMGVYRYSDYRFDNKSFMLNSLEYLTDKDNLLEARTKNFKTQLLDPKRVEAERSFWQMINIGVPVVLILLMGGIYFFVRKKKYN